MTKSSTEVWGRRVVLLSLRVGARELVHRTVVENIVATNDDGLSLTTVSLGIGRRVCRQDQESPPVHSIVRGDSGKDDLLNDTMTGDDRDRDPRIEERLPSSCYVRREDVNTPHFTRERQEKDVYQDKAP